MVACQDKPRFDILWRDFNGPQERHHDLFVAGFALQSGIALQHPQVIAAQLKSTAKMDSGLVFVA